MSSTNRGCKKAFHDGQPLYADVYTGSRWERRRVLEGEDGERKVVYNDKLMSLKIMQESGFAGRAYVYG